MHFNPFQVHICRISVQPLRQEGCSLAKITKKRCFEGVPCKFNFSTPFQVQSILMPDSESLGFFLYFKTNLSSIAPLDHEILYFECSPILDSTIHIFVHTIKYFGYFWSKNTFPHTFEGVFCDKNDNSMHCNPFQVHFYRISVRPLRQVGYSLAKITKKRCFEGVPCKFNFSTPF